MTEPPKEATWSRARRVWAYLSILTALPAIILITVAAMNGILL